jgi:RNA polymerase Rpb6
VIQRPPDFGAFQFVVLSALRAAQLMRGCTPRVDHGIHKPIITAQWEVAEGKVTAVPDAHPVVGRPAGISDAPVDYVPELVTRA